LNLSKNGKDLSRRFLFKPFKKKWILFKNSLKNRFRVFYESVNEVESKAFLDSFFYVECIKRWVRKSLKNMNYNVISQLLTTFIIVSLGPAVVVYLSTKKAL
jgi:hypothetical protein